ncbi:MAG: hypothetical protein EBX97_04890, partial [Actinobacteria bacterium]|nr:hypothetical protein [Actinomycetota bacterium]
LPANDSNAQKFMIRIIAILSVLTLFSCSSERKAQYHIRKALKHGAKLTQDTDTIRIATVDSFPVISHDSIVWEKFIAYRDTVIKFQNVYVPKTRWQTRIEYKERVKTLRIKFVIEPRMVRGLDYYTRTTFEFEHHALGAQSGIGGGGRYDGLMKELGGAELSGIGFAMGIDRIALACEAEKVSGSSESSLDLYMIALSSESKSAVLALVHGLREAGICADINFGDRGLKGAMKAADRLGAKFVAVIGEDELNAGTVKIKEMSTGVESAVRLAHSDLLSHVSPKK